MNSVASDPSSVWPLAIARRVDDVCLSYEASWKAALAGARRPMVEDFLGQGPEPERSILLLELLSLDLIYRNTLGEPVAFSEYAERFPEDVRMLTEIWRSESPAGLLGPASVPELLKVAWSPSGGDRSSRHVQSPPPSTIEFSSASARAEAENQGALAPTGGQTTTMGVTLKVTQGPHEGKIFEFHRHDTFLVGRSKDAHFRLPRKDKYISRIHFLVEINPPLCRLMDMGSSNGTSVNGRKVATAELKEGDFVRAGRTVFGVSIEQEEMSTADATSHNEVGPNAEDDPRRQAPTIVVETRPLIAKSEHPDQFPRRASRHTKESSRHCHACGSPLANLGQAERVQSTGCCSQFCLSCWEQVQDQPQPIPGYLLVRELGRGGMGTVYLALRTRDNRRLALKAVKPGAAASPLQLARFIREAEILRQLDHPYIVPFREMGEFDGQLYFTMDFVNGSDASRLLGDNGGPLPARRAVRLICQLLKALEYAHGEGFIHRDIKPANVLVTQDQGREVVKLADFGLARAYQMSPLSGLTMTGLGGGTIAFIPPEQITKFHEADPASDQYSAGATLYNLLTDRFVHDLPSSRNAQLLKILLEEPVPIQTRGADIPEPIVAIIHRMIARAPEARYPNVRAARTALAKCFA